MFPSPSDSFKSDTPLPCPELEESGEWNRSGGNTPKRPRDGSPKWALPRRERWQSPGSASSDFKPSPAKEYVLKSKSVDYSSDSKLSNRFRSYSGSSHFKSLNSMPENVFESSSYVDTLESSEFGVRFRLAELQRQYRDKQKELARLQYRSKDKDKDTKDIISVKSSAKRPRGRPRKKTINPSKNSLDERYVIFLIFDVALFLLKLLSSFSCYILYCLS